MKTIVREYAFNKTAKTVTLPNVVGLRLEGFMLIVNSTRQTVIFDPTTVGLGGTLSGNVLTLAFDTSTHADTDALQIYYDDGVWDSDQNLIMLQRILEAIRNPDYLSNTNQSRMLRCILDTNSALNNITTLTALGQLGPAGAQLNASELAYSNLRLEYSEIRNKITIS
jgi:hypothetical protein